MATIRRPTSTTILLSISAAAVFAAAIAFAQTAPPRPRAPVVTWNIPSVDQLPDNEQGRLARYGRSLLTATYAHIGPNVSNPEKRYAGNNLACANCHLDAGLKKFGLLLVGAYADYPAYSKRTGRESTIEDRINNCMTRSMNGRALPPDSRELAALATYLKVLSTGIDAGADVIGQGAGSMALLTRAADPERGQRVFNRTCAAECHGTDGAGVRNGTASDALGYLVPPLWGSDSFNDGDHHRQLRALEHAERRELVTADGVAGRCLGRGGLCGVAVTAAQSRPYGRLPGPAHQAGGRAVRALCGRLLGDPAQVRSVRPDRSRRPPAARRAVQIQIVVADR